jgi:hypothetical protein
MAGSWRTARVFISSTFTDMGAERECLVKAVFPELRERLLPHRIYVEDIDLRWGTTEDEAKEDKVLDLCLQHIDECRPFFIGILGERYGWVPAEHISSQAAKKFERYGRTELEPGSSVTELEILFGVLLMDPRMKERSSFYFRDPRFLNSIPRGQYAEVRHQTVGTTKRSIAAIPSARLRKNVLQPCDGGPLLRAIYLATLVWPMSIPSLSSSA